MAIEAFKIHVPDVALSTLKEKLAQTRWTDAVAGSGWTYGVDIDYMMAIRDYWMNRFDWRGMRRIGTGSLSTGFRRMG